MSQAPLFEPDHGYSHTVLLACGHKTPCPPPDRLPRRADEWYAARFCEACGRPREVVSIHNPAGQQ